MKVERDCRNCGVKFTTKLRPNRGFYCSKSCLNLFRTGKPANNKYPDTGAKISKSKKGKPATEKQLAALRALPSQIGHKHRHFYKDGRISDPEYLRWSNQAWKRRKRKADGSHSFVEWENLRAQHDWKCVFCGKREPEIKLTEDHIIPLSRGGSDNIENIQPLCRRCNSSKGAKILTNKKWMD